MYHLTIKHKFHSGDVVYFMKDNEIKKGIVSKVDIDIRNDGFSNGNYVEKLFKQLITSFNKERKYKINIKYIIDLLDKNDKYHSTPHYFGENQLFSDKDELIKIL